MSELTQALPTVEFNSDSGSESILDSNLGSFYDKPGSFPMRLWNAASIHQEINSSFLQGSSMKSGPFPFGLDNMAKSNQALLQEEARPVRRVPPIGAQEGLVLTITPQDYIVH
jgi:hypothetical protein